MGKPSALGLRVKGESIPIISQRAAAVSQYRPDPPYVSRARTVRAQRSRGAARRPPRRRRLPGPGSPKSGTRLPQPATPARRRHSLLGARRGRTEAGPGVLGPPAGSPGGGTGRSAGRRGPHLPPTFCCMFGPLSRGPTGPHDSEKWHQWRWRRGEAVGGGQWAAVATVNGRRRRRREISRKQKLQSVPIEGAGMQGAFRSRGRSGRQTEGATSPDFRFGKWRWGWVCGCASGDFTFRTMSAPGPSTCGACGQLPSRVL